MFQQFINRKEELNILEGRFASGKPEFILIYGRRRVGKTELVTHFTKSKPSIYFLAEEKRYADNLNEMKSVMSTFLNDEEFGRINFENWAQLFKSFLGKISERTIVVIDEFPYLVMENSAIPSEFQKIWDLYLSKSDKIMLVLVGSSISMMEKLLGRKSPLFGRRTAQLEVKPVSVFCLKEFFPEYSPEECINVYGCTDGIPLYLKQFNTKVDFFENAKQVFFRRDSPLYSEAEILLKQEFREPANYFLILKAISFGNTKQNEIVNYTNIDKSIISKYLKNLEEIRVIKRKYPVTERKETRKSSRYAFSDNYFMFWFRYVYPAKTQIESDSREAIDAMKRTYDAYMGFIFENAAEQFLWRHNSYTKLGRWWHKDQEIDLIALNENKKEISFFECKWKDLKEGTARKILEDLKGKSSSVDWNKSKRKEYFGLVAKKIENKKKLRNEGYFVFDIVDFEKLR